MAEIYLNSNSTGIFRWVNLKTYPNFNLSSEVVPKMPFKSYVAKKDIYKYIKWSSLNYETKFRNVPALFSFPGPTFQTASRCA